ncbi:MAG: ABC transporter permease [Bdellovibrionales bacterium]|nr:ABC transporter permease [Bdellovibrionales bacterium]
MNLPASQERTKESALKKYTATTLRDLWKEADGLSRASGWKLFVHHVGRSIETLRSEWWQFGLNIVTASLLLFLFAALLWFFEVLGSSVQVHKDVTTLVAYFSDDVLSSEREELQADFGKNPSVEEVWYVSKEMALAEFQQSLGENATVLQGLESDNPLPPSLRIRLKDQENVEEIMDGFAKRLRQHPAILEVQYPKELLRKFVKLLRLFRGIGLAVAFGLALLIGYLVGSTIRLSIFARRREIEIMGLVGATDQYVRAPFLIEGALVGFLGAGLGFALLYGVVAAIRPLFPVEIVQFFPSLNESGFSVLSFFVVFVVGLSSALLGSVLAVHRFQRSG